MLNKVLNMLRRYNMVSPGDTVVAAVSGGADSVALLYALYLLREKLCIKLEAVHFNHGLRSAESDRDEVFVRDLCDRLDISCHVGRGIVIPGKKGLEAAARQARYAYFDTLPGKIATAHNADDNAETVLMHMIRGTGLKGLGGITPIRGRIIRPLLGVTRQEVLDFLKEHYLSFVEDSSNATDAFLRNRLRHQVIPLLKGENPRLAENLSAMALRLRQDEEALASLSAVEARPNVQTLRDMPPALRSRAIVSFLKRSGVPEPDAEHIALTEKLIFSGKPSARAYLPGGVIVTRNYGVLTVLRQHSPLETVALPQEGAVELPGLGLRVVCVKAEGEANSPDSFTVCPQGNMFLRCRRSGDALRLTGGRKEVKKLFIDRKIPAQDRLRIPVIADDLGILGIYGFGADLDRLGPGTRITFIKTEESTGGLDDET